MQGYELPARTMTSYSEQIQSTHKQSIRDNLLEKCTASAVVRQRNAQLSRGVPKYLSASYERAVRR